MHKLFILINLIMVQFYFNQDNTKVFSYEDSFPILKVYDETLLSNKACFVSDKEEIELFFDTSNNCFLMYDFPKFSDDFKIVTDKYESQLFSGDIFDSHFKTIQSFISFKIKTDSENRVNFYVNIENNERYIYTSYDCCVNVETNLDNYLISLNIKGYTDSYLALEKKDIGTNSIRIINTFFVPKDSIMDNNYLSITIFNATTLSKVAKSNELLIKEGDNAFLFYIFFENESLILSVKDSAFQNEEKISSAAVSEIVSKYFTYEPNKNNGYIMWPSVIKTWIKDGSSYYLDLPMEDIVIYDFNKIDDYKTGQNKIFKTSLKNKSDKMQTLFEIYEKQNKTESKTMTIVFFAILIISSLLLTFLLLFIFIKRFFVK